MIYMKSKLILYALFAISLSSVFNVIASDDVPNRYFCGYYLYNSHINSADIDFYTLRSYLPSKGIEKSDSEEYGHSEKEYSREEETEYLSEDENIVFDSQKCHITDYLNETNYTIDSQSMLCEKPNIEFADNTSPQILIVHTHTSESYGYKRAYPLTDTDRTQDKEYNMVRVGRELKKELNKFGYNVLHDETVHDYPSYTSSYKRAGETIEKYLKTYPSIFAVFDIHRDAIINAEGKSIGLVSMQNDEECAQMMIVCGTDQNNLKFDLWEENLRFAFKIQNYIQKSYPGLMRNINIRKERFNLHLTKGSLLFEIGTNGNSLNQALNSVEYLAEGIDGAIKSIN